MPFICFVHVIAIYYEKNKTILKIKVVGTLKAF